MTMFSIDQGGLDISLLLLRGMAVQHSWRQRDTDDVWPSSAVSGHKLSVKFTAENNNSGLCL